MLDSHALRRRLGAGLFAGAVAAAVFASPVRAHDPYTKWERPDTGGSCCNNQDCRQATARYTGAGWEVLDGDKWLEVPPGRVLDTRNYPNPDGMHHVCIGPQRHIYCFMPGEAKF
jgi:hypothetical protein